MQESSSSTPARASPARAAAATIDRIVVGGRSTYFCPSCQVKLNCREASATPGNVGGVPGTTVKTEAVVLRSIRYGEADRILHLYSQSRGRSGRSPRARASRNPASGAGWSRSSASTSSSTKAAAT